MRCSFFLRRAEFVASIRGANSSFVIRARESEASYGNKSWRSSCKLEAAIVEKNCWIFRKFGPATNRNRLRMLLDRSGGRDLREFNMSDSSMSLRRPTPSEKEG